MKVKCLIVDDENLALDVLEEFIGRIDVLQLAGRCSNATDALGILNKTHIDLLFTDIQMPGLTGMQFLRNLANAPAIIITTAHPDYAIEGYELDVLDYLLKPISFERFFRAVNCFFTRRGKGPLLSLPPFENHPANDPFIFVKSGKRMVKVMYSAISYIESIRNYVVINLTDNRQVKTLNTITRIEALLPEDDFIRIHRSFILPVNKIQTFTSGTVQADGNYIPIGRNYRTYVLRRLNKNCIS